MSREPQRLGQYELREHVAHGGMGSVWKAFDTQLQRYVAIKILHVERQNDPELMERFEREAQLIASLHHPNIIQIHDFQFAHPPDTTVSYMVMDYIQGETLADYIHKTARKQLFPPADDIVYIFTAISLALDYAHQQGLVHRDIKPANILLDQQPPLARPIGNPILTDFGIARVQGAPTGTVIGTFLGTPLYISPEQAQGKQADRRSDLYSLGIILYEMLTGVTPFRGETTMAILVQHLQATPTPPALINPNIPPALSAMILKSIAKAPEARFPTASAMTIALAAACNMPVPKSLVESTPAVQSAGTSLAFPAYIARPAALNPSVPSPLSFIPPAPSSTQASTPLQNAAPSLKPTSNAGDSQHIPREGEYNLAPQRPRRLALFVIGLLVVLLIGAGWGAFALFFQRGANAPNTVVGQIRFISSPHSIAGSYDEVQIDLQNIAHPPSGYVYYAWIEAASTESDKGTGPHWPLNFSNGAIHSPPLASPAYSNLLLPRSVLLITEEPGNFSPIVHSTGLYYASITQAASTTTFDIMQCPSNSVASVCSSV